MNWARKERVKIGKAIDRTGKIVNRLEFLRRSNKNSNYWVVRCYCGEDFETAPRKIETGHTKSCGCLMKTTMKSGDVYHGITLVKRLETDKPPSSSKWLMVCHCGEEFKSVAGKIKNSYVKSCGCSHFKHKGRGTRLYTIWKNMRQRCNNPKNNAYNKYGGRGIKICKEWQDSFNSFQEWAQANGYADNLSLDRTNNDKGYSPENCAWVDNTTQNRNQGVRTPTISGVRGVTLYKPTQEWLARIHVNYKAIHLGYFSEIKKAVQARREAENFYWGKEYQDFDFILNNLEKGDWNT